MVQLLSLVASPSTQARVAAFAMATAVISQHTESLVVEAELDTDGTQVYELPSSLMKLLGQPPSPMSALLGWALVFGFFENAVSAALGAQARITHLWNSSPSDSAHRTMLSSAMLTWSAQGCYRCFSSTWAFRIGEDHLMSHDGELTSWTSHVRFLRLGADHH